MNKKTFITVLLIATVMVPATLLFASCGKQTTAKTSSSTSSGYEMPGLMGEVTDKAGNDVTLKLIEIPKMANRSTSGSFSRPASGSFSRPAGGSFSRPSSGSYSRPSGASGTSRQKAVQYTGETKEIIIPVGTKIVTTQISQSSSGASSSTSRTASGGGMNGRFQMNFVEVAVSVDKIQIGDTLSFYYAKDGKTITKVTVSSASSGGSGFAGFFGGRAGGGANANSH